MQSLNTANVRNQVDAGSPLVHGADDNSTGSKSAHRANRLPIGGLRLLRHCLGKRYGIRGGHAVIHEAGVHSLREAGFAPAPNGPGAMQLLTGTTLWTSQVKDLF
jgi:hypothetical protein